MTRAETSVVYPRVVLGDGCHIGHYVVVGFPPHGSEPGSLPTVIGVEATLRSHTVVYAGTKIGARLQTGHGALIRELSSLGDGVSIGSHTVVEHHVRIGNGVRIHSQAFVPEYCEIEDDVWVGPHAVLTNARYPASNEAKQSLQGVRLLRGAKIGASATILPGVVVGAGALVGAGSVVARDVPEGVVVAGNPAKVIRQVEEIEAYRR